MPENNSFKLTNILAVLGWIVAMLSLALNWRIYNDNQKQKNAKEKETPTYTYDLATYDTDNIPDEIKALKNDITHNFVINHISGGAIKGLLAEFRSENGPIKSITVTEGTNGVTKKVEPNGVEASLRKPELLKSRSIRGYVTTAGISKLSLMVAADEGKKSTGYIPSSSDNQWFESDFLFLALILGGFAIILVLLFYKALPAIRESGIVPNAGQSYWSLFSLFLLLFLVPDFGFLPGVNNLFSAVIVYFVITNYKNIVKAIENLANSNTENNDVETEA